MGARTRCVMGALSRLARGSDRAARPSVEVRPPKKARRRAPDVAQQDRPVGDPADRLSRGDVNAPAPPQAPTTWRVRSPPVGVAAASSCVL